MNKLKPKTETLRRLATSELTRRQAARRRWGGRGGGCYFEACLFSLGPTEADVPRSAWFCNWWHLRRERWEENHFCQRHRSFPSRSCLRALIIRFSLYSVPTFIQSFFICSPKQRLHCCGCFYCEVSSFFNLLWISLILKQKDMNSIVDNLGYTLFVCIVADDASKNKTDIITKC